MRQLICLLVSIAAVCNANCQVNGAEYFIDTDPGYRNGITLAVTPGTDINLGITLSLSSAATGFHTVGLRARDAQNRWSQTYLHPFFIVAAPPASIAGSEYFIDTDPGYDNGTDIAATVGTDSVLKYAVPLSSLTAGFHIFGMRSKDNRGNWSQTTLHSFYLSERNIPVNITRLEYYFSGDGATNTVYTYPLPNPSILADLNFTADLSQLVGDKEYNMHVCAVNEKGERSEVYLKKIKVCNGEVPGANFDFIPLGTQVSFIDSSRGKVKYQWNFGDGKIDSVSNPVHAYASGGNYTVKQIVSNFCRTDTATKLVSVLTLQSIYPSAGGNKGYVTVSVKGAGFSAGTVIRLLGSGSEIKADSVFVNKTGNVLTGILNLNGKQPGVYNVVVNTNNAYDTLKSAFVIQEGELPDVFVDIIGRDVIRGNGTEQKYSIHFGNKSNNDVYAMPLWITGLPKNARWHLYAAIDTMDENNNATPVEIMMNDSTKAITLIISRLPAKSDFTVQLGIAVPSIGDTLQLVSWLSQSLFSGTATIEEEPTYESVQSIINYAAGEITGAALSSNCLTESAKAFYGFLKNTAVRQPVVDPLAPRFFSTYTRLLVETGKAISACAGNVFGNDYETFYKNFLQPLYELESHFGERK
ncbi:MAG: PKD domain-containing protein [Ferruginibacter sp.]